MYAVRLSLLGHVREVLAPNAAAADQLRRAWSRCLDGGPVTHEALQLPELNLPLSPPMQLRLVSELTQRAIEQADPHVILLHAAGVSAPSGLGVETCHVIGLVGASGVGKTTAAVALGQAGWGYATDECLAVHSDLRVLPYPKPVCVLSEQAAGDGDAKLVVGPDELGLAAASGPLRLARLVALRRASDRPGAPLARPMPALDAVALLVAQSSGLTRAPRPLQRLVALLRATGGMVALDYADIGQLVAEPSLLVELLTPAPVGDAGDSGLDSHGGGPEPVPGVERLEPHLLDAVVDRHGALVLREETTIRLGPATAQVWQAMLSGADDALTAYRRAWGEHAVGEHLRALDRQQLLPGAAG